MTTPDSLTSQYSIAAKLLLVGLLAIATGCSPKPPQITGSPSPQTQADPSPKAASLSTPSSKTAVQGRSAGQPKAIAFNNQGVAKLAKEDYKGSMADFNRAIQVDPKLAEAYLGRGIAQSGLRLRQDAMKSYSQAIKLNPGFAAAYFNRADEYALMGKRKQAIADFDKAAQLFAKQGDTANTRLAKTRIDELKTPPVATNPTQPPTTNTTAAATPSMALAMHLKKVGAKMYGTYWCSACNWQRQEFGEAAFSQITYVECDPGGPNPQPALCNQANIQAFPTWEIGGRLYPPGGFPLAELASMTGYQGPRNF